MAPNRRTQPQKPPSLPPPTADSSDDDEEEEQSDSGLESDQEHDRKQSQSEASSDDDDREGDESGEEESASESEQERPTANPRRLVAPAPPPTPAPAPAPTPAPPPTATDGKSQVKSFESESEKDGTPSNSMLGETAKKSFQRIWSDEDQITLLKGMIDFVDLKGKDPISNIEDFCLFIQKSLRFPATESQLVAKIRGLRWKYKNNEGKDKVFSKPHDAEAFKLSKKIWGADEKKRVVENDGGKKRKTGRKDWEASLNGADHGVKYENNVKVDLDEGLVCANEMVSLCKRLPGWDENDVRATLKSIEEPKKRLLEGRWNKQKMEELRIFASRKALETDTLNATFGGL